MTGPGLTPAQTAGPFFADCLLADGVAAQVLVRGETAGERIRIEGRVLDGDGAPVADALIELWQADHAGRYRHAADPRGAAPADGFTGFGRGGTDDDGRYWFETVKPGPVPFDGERMQAPHILVLLHARGLLNHLVTRLYFAGDPANDHDPVLARVPAERRPTLLATGESGAGTPVYRFDIVLQGSGETAFFNV